MSGLDQGGRTGEAIAARVLTGTEVRGVGCWLQNVNLCSWEKVVCSSRLSG